jgi:hypothetical protein
LSSTRRRAWHLWCAALGGAALLTVTSQAPSLAATGASARSAAGLSTNYDFARLVLQDGHWPVSSNNVTVLTQWLRAEEPTSDWWDRDNPLNNGLGSGGGSGLGSYSSLMTAAHEVARNLENSAWGYPAVLADLVHSSAPALTARAIWRSSWAAGHYGLGADWDTSPVPSVAAPPVAWSSQAECSSAPSDIVTTCASAFTATGSAWHWAQLPGVVGDELWVFAGHASAGTATWYPKLLIGTYEVDAFVPSQFADAVASYVVVDARGGHRVLVNQEPYNNTWVPLGQFTAGERGSIRVVLQVGTSGSSSGTYLAASEMRFTPIADPQEHARDTSSHNVLVVRPPGVPQDVAAIAGNGRVLVSWLAPSKDGGDAVGDYEATALPGGRTCTTVDARLAAPSCTVDGLANGSSYRFVVRAKTTAGSSAASTASAPVVPLQSTTVKVTTLGTSAYGEVVRFRATLDPVPSSGLVLFALDGRVLPGCGSASVMKGRASCAARLTKVGPLRLLVTFSGSTSSAGAEAISAVVVGRAKTQLRAAVDPTSAPPSAIVAVRAWRLPGAATGTLLFTSGAARLCATAVRSGGGSCSFRLKLSSGVHEIIATYFGSRTFLRAVARTTVRVVVPPTT